MWELARLLAHAAHRLKPFATFSNGSPKMAIARILLVAVFVWLFPSGATRAQIAPSPTEVAAYSGLHAAAAKGDAGEIRRLAATGADLNAQDRHGRTPLMVAAHRRHIDAARALIDAKADLNLLDAQAYDVITIAAVIDDVDTVKLAIASGGSARAITSPYRGTALIAAAHLGHAEVVAALIAGKAPLDHVNNLGWTALIEAIVLGDGGPRHQATVEALVMGGADFNLPDRQGARPLALARARGYGKIAQILEQAGAKP
jgi:ankyrin repeat protein